MLWIQSIILSCSNTKPLQLSLHELEAKHDTTILMAQKVQSILKGVKDLYSKYGKQILRARTVAVRFIAASIIVQLLVAPVIGNDMLPTLKDGDWIIIDWISSKEYSKGDIVLAAAGRRSKFAYSIAQRCCRNQLCAYCYIDITVNISRIAAVSGETVHYEDEKGNLQTVCVPKDSFWLRGDNPTESFDSRIFGSVPMRRIVGRAYAKFSFFPFCFVSFARTDENSADP